MSAGAGISLASLFAGFELDVPNLVVRSVTADSRRLTPGDLFLACRGRNGHGLDYLDAALAAGAAAVAWEPDPGRQPPVFPSSVAGFPVEGLHSKLGLLGDRFFGQPSAALSVAGITGTNGKTTVAYLVAQALAQLGQSAGYLGTLGYGFPGRLRPAELTTPDCIEMHRRLDELAAAGATHAVAEVSSHGLDQGRIDGVRLQVGALTNFSQDHLDYHGDLASYAAAKARLFTEHRPPTAVINVGDHWGRELAVQLPDDIELVSVALLAEGNAAPAARLLGRLTAARRDGLGLAFTGDFGEAALDSALWGEFNAENLVVAAGILLAFGYRLDEVALALEHCTAPPGRMERIAATKEGPEVVIDFAHTPDALDQALRAMRSHTAGAVWCVFGCGGDRDRGKRSAMGEVAARLADQVVVTDDNPRSEDPAQIAAEILAGIRDSDRGRVQRIADRARAIEYALTRADLSDAVLIAGKGHETRQLVGNRAFDFSDAAVARAALAGAA